MATPLSKEKAQKQQLGEVPPGPKNEVALAPGDACGVSNPDPGASVPSVSSDLSPSGGGALHSGTAGSSASALAAVGAISITGEGPWLPFMGCVPERERANLQGGHSPRAELKCVVPEAGQGLQTSHAGSVATMVQAMRGVGPASGPPTQAISPGKGHGRELTSHEETAQAQKPPRRRCLFPGPQCPVPVPPSSPTSQPHGRRRSRASLCGLASQPGPALRSQARPGPALRSQAARPGPAVNSRGTPPGPAFHGHASGLGPALRNRTSAPGPAHRRRSASAPGPALHSRASAPGPALQHRHVPGSGSALRSHRHASSTGPALRSHRHASSTGPALRSHRHASSTGPALRSRLHASLPGPALHSRRHASSPGPALRSHRRTSSPGPALRNRRSHTAVSGPALRRRTSAPGPAPQGRASESGPALRHRRASASGPALHRRAAAQGPAYRRGAATPGSALSRPASSSRASGPGPAVNNHASPPGPALRSRASGSGPALRSRANQIGLALRNSFPTPGFVLRSRTILRSSPRSHASLPVSAGLSPPSSSGLALRRLVCQSRSSSPNPEAPSLAAQPHWHAVRMRASSPSPPGRLFPFFEQCGGSSSSASGSPGQSPSSSSSFSSSSSSSSASSSTNFSGQSPSSPTFCGLGSISTPSPASLRRALLPELDALSPLSAEEQAETGSMPSSPTRPVV
ncbi:EZH inhibitory protein [Canis lupus familiaris]|uniref:EZH inhibitory protein n=1 Tax=Canis lupus familiaris TaxID=9615 RepID=A0A8P0TNW6_CANLF|nr:EZH inhibitory protein [Canis lupus familiaris]